MSYPNFRPKVTPQNEREQRLAFLENVEYQDYLGELNVPENIRRGMTVNDLTTERRTEIENILRARGQRQAPDNQGQAADQPDRQAGRPATPEATAAIDATNQPPTEAGTTEAEQATQTTRQTTPTATQVGPVRGFMHDAFKSMRPHDGPRMVKDGLIVGGTTAGVLAATNAASWFPGSGIAAGITKAATAITTSAGTVAGTMGTLGLGAATLGGLYLAGRIRVETLKKHYEENIDYYTKELPETNRDRQECEAFLKRYEELQFNRTLRPWASVREGVILSMGVVTEPIISGTHYAGRLIGSIPELFKAKTWKDNKFWGGLKNLTVRATKVGLWGAGTALVVPAFIAGGPALAPASFAAGALAGWHFTKKKKSDSSVAA